MSLDHVLTSLLKVANILQWPLILVFFLLSKRWADGRYEGRDTLTNVSIGAINAITYPLISYPLMHAAYTWAHGNGLGLIKTSSPLSWLLAILVADFVYYWDHRAGHQVRLLWNVHAVHHSSERYNLSTAMRLPMIGALLRTPFFILMACAGFPPVMVLGGYSVVLFYQIWIHNRVIGDLPRWFEAVFNSPSHHRVHHARNAEYLDKNFGGILIVWDKLFGTFAPERAEVEFGVTEPIRSNNLFVINFRDLARTFHDAAQERSVVRALALILGKPKASLAHLAQTATPRDGLRS